MASTIPKNNEFVDRLTSITEANINNPEFKIIITEMESKFKKQKEEIRRSMESKGLM